MQRDDAIGLVQRPPDVDVRRTVHFKILPDTHAMFRLLCVRRGLSMQEVFEELAQLAVSDDPGVTAIIDRLVKQKRKRYYRQLSSTDAESIYTLIEDESPLR